jgi:hypothetical protein
MKQKTTLKFQKKLEDSKQPFPADKLPAQLRQECVFPDFKEGYGQNQRTDTTRWGGENDSDYTYCLTLLSRINGVLSSNAFKCVFQDTKNPITNQINSFVEEKNKN